MHSRQYLVQFMANDLKRMPTTSVELPFEGIERPIPALAVHNLVLPYVVRIFLSPRPSPPATAPAPLTPKELVRLRLLLLAQNAVRSAESPPGTDAAVPPHDLFGLSPRIWAAEAPRYMTKDAYAAVAEHLHEAARKDGMRALAEALAQREGKPAQQGQLVTHWVIALRLLAALFAVRSLDPLLLSTAWAVADPSRTPFSRRSPGAKCVALPLPLRPALRH